MCRYRARLYIDFSETKPNCTLYYTVFFTFLSMQSEGNTTFFLVYMLLHSLHCVKSTQVFEQKKKIFKLVSQTISLGTFSFKEIDCRSSVCMLCVSYHLYIIM